MAQKIMYSLSDIHAWTFWGEDTMNAVKEAFEEVTYTGKDFTQELKNYIVYLAKTEQGETDVKAKLINDIFKSEISAQELDKLMEETDKETFAKKIPACIKVLVNVDNIFFVEEGDEPSPQDDENNLPIFENMVRVFDAVGTYFIQSMGFGDSFSLGTKACFDYYNLLERYCTMYAYRRGIAKP